MRVEVAARYAYDTDLDVKVGDVVLLPESPFSGGPWTARVTNLKADYDGPVKRILGILQPEPGTFDA